MGVKAVLRLGESNQKGDTVPNLFSLTEHSKLTFLLRDSLGGNSKTVIIANITQAQISQNETLSTL